MTGPTFPGRSPARPSWGQRERAVLGVYFEAVAALNEHDVDAPTAVDTVAHDDVRDDEPRTAAQWSTWIGDDVERARLVLEREAGRAAPRLGLVQLAQRVVDAAERSGDPPPHIA